MTIEGQAVGIRGVLEGYSSSSQESKIPSMLSTYVWSLRGHKKP